MVLLKISLSLYKRAKRALKLLINGDARSERRGRAFEDHGPRQRRRYHDFVAAGAAAWAGFFAAVGAGDGAALLLSTPAFAFAAL